MFGSNFDKIQLSKALTKDDIRKLKNKESHLGNTIEVGDRIFTYLLCLRENNEIVKSAKVGIEYELPLLACDYHLMDENQKIPEFWKDI